MSFEDKYRETQQGNNFHYANTLIRRVDWNGTEYAICSDVFDQVLKHINDHDAHQPLDETPPIDLSSPVSTTNCQEKANQIEYIWKAHLETRGLHKQQPIWSDLSVPYTGDRSIKVAKALLEALEAHTRVRANGKTRA